MERFEEIFVSFGFKDGPLIVAYLCILILLGNFMGGLISNILLALRGSPIVKRKLTNHMSFRLTLTSELCLVVYVIYYHAVLITEITWTQAFYWLFVLLAAPLLAALGAQSSYLIYAKKINELKFQSIENEKLECVEKMAANTEG